MKVLLVNINREHLPDPVPPIGIACVGGALLEAGHDVRVCDLCFTDDPNAQLQADLAAFAPSAVGISMRNIDNAAFPNSISYLPFARQVVDTIRAHSSAPIILGGSAFSLLPQAYLHQLDATMGVVGEGEETLPRLLAALEAGQAPASVPGVATPGQAGFIPARPLLRPAAAVQRGWSLLDIDAYWRASGQLPIQTKRGCSFGCAYCTYPALEGVHSRPREPGEVVDEIAAWQRDHAVNHFFFVDNVFNSPLEHAGLILEEIVRRELRVGWTAYVSPRFSTPEFAALMARSGCKGVEVGVDGGSATTMRTLNKGFEVEDVRRYFRDAAAAGVRTCCTLIFGGPGENAATLDETFALTDEVGADAVVAMVGVRVYPGTALWPVAVASGQVRADGDPLVPSFYLSPELTDADLRSIVERAAARPNWVLPGENVGLDKDLFARLREKQVKGPLWRLMPRGPGAGGSSAPST